MNATIDLYGYIDEQGVHFKKFIQSVVMNKLPVAWHIRCFKHGGRQFHVFFGP